MAEWMYAHTLPVEDHPQSCTCDGCCYGDVHEEPELCPTCDGEKEWVECWHCHGDGGFDSDALMEQDPLWYDGVAWEACRECEGRGGFYLCPNCEMV